LRRRDADLSRQVASALARQPHWRERSRLSAAAGDRSVHLPRARLGEAAARVEERLVLATLLLDVPQEPHDLRMLAKHLHDVIAPIMGW